MARLYLEDDAGNVRIVPMEADEVSIGRAEDNVLVLPDRNVSRHHARLRAVNGRFFVEDAGARYGLFLNGTRVQERSEVRPGDLVGLGDYKIKILPGDGVAEAEAPESRPVRHTTVPDIPAVVEAEPGGEPFSDTSLISLRDMERVARQGWPSDFEGRDEAAQRKSLTRRLIVLGVLVAIAVLLVWAYLWVTQPTEIETSIRPPARVAEGARTLEVAEPVAPVPRPAPLPEPVATEPEPPPPTAPPPTAEPPAAPRKVEQEARAPEPAKEPARLATAAAPRADRPAAAESPRASRPPAAPSRPPQTASVPAAGGDPMAAIEAAIKAGNLGEAERLLAQCRGPTCANGWKKLGNSYKAVGQHRRAISAYERAIATTRDASLKSWCERQIDSIRKGLGEQ